MATEELFRSEPYTRVCTATVVASDNDGIVLDRTIFYPEGGGQPGDTGLIGPATGNRDIRIIDTVRRNGEVLHVVEPFTARLKAGTPVNLILDWPRRHRHMRMHTCLHLLCAVFGDAKVTGGSIGADKGRLDFNLPDAPVPREQIQAGLDRLIEADLEVRTRWITDEELAAQPDLVRTMSVHPPSGQDRVRLVEVIGVDLQPCGGTHVARTGEIGRIVVGKIESKGSRNRRINLRFADA
ncbi:MAG: alanyl-tRNA editing protein [Gammaproteobacteria bacterium]|nr:alanyl-tRNA editing protein [Gammaproteobacteria bacterium]